MGGMGQVDECIIADVEAGLAAGLFKEDLTLGDHVDLAQVSLHEPDMTSSAIGAARLRCRKFTNADGAKLGHAYLVGQVLTSPIRMSRAPTAPRTASRKYSAREATGTSAARTSTLIESKDYSTTYQWPAPRGRCGALTIAMPSALPASPRSASGPRTAANGKSGSPPRNEGADR
jgi:hypothetical protein